MIYDICSSKVSSHIQFDKNVQRICRIGYNQSMNKTTHDSETKAENQQVITACAFIHHNFDGTEKVFLPKRAATKKFLPGVYELPGGHIDFGEELVDGLKREIFEEFGMHIAVGDPFAAFTSINEVKGSHSVEIVYFARFTNPLGQIILNPDDHSEYLWLSEVELPKAYVSEKGTDDIEIHVSRKAFALLKGEKIQTI